MYAYFVYYSNAILFALGVVIHLCRLPPHSRLQAAAPRPVRPPDEAARSQPHRVRSGTSSVLEAEFVPAIAAKFKLLEENKPALAKLETWHKELIKAARKSTLVSPTGGGLEDDGEVVEAFENKLADYSVRKLSDYANMAESAVAGLPTCDVRRVL